MNLKRIVLGFAASISLFVSASFAEAPLSAFYSDADLNGMGFRKRASSESLELYFNQEDCIFAVRVKESGYVWYSSPLDWEDDEEASGFAMNTMGSLLSIRAKDQRSTFRTANSIVNVVRRNGLEVTPIENGIHLENDFTRDGILIPMDICLDGDSLLLSVDASGIVETPDEEMELDLNLLDFELVPYFGAAPKGEEGFIMVPDGSGAMIRFDNGKSSSGYQQYVYGRDPSIVPARKRNDFQNISLPVYGMCREGAGFIGIFEGSKARGILSAETSGQLTSFNAVSPGFVVRDFDSVSFRERTGTPRDVRIYEKKSFEKLDETYSVRIKFLSGTENSLAGMARAYRNYLQEKSAFPKERHESSPSLVLNYIGAGVKKRTVLGIPMNVNVAYTKFDQVRESVEKLRASGVSDFVVKFDGWTSSGVLGKYPAKSKPASILGGSGDFKKLVSWLSEENIPFYAGADFVQLYQGDIVRIKELTVNRMINKSPVKIPDYRLSTYTDEKTSDNYPYYLLRTGKVKKYFNDFMRGLNGLRGCEGLGLAPDSLGNMLSTDFGRKGLSRNETLREFSSLLEETSKNHPLCLSRPFDYALSSVSYITDLPVVCSRFDIEDASVPFYQMVVQGYIPYSNVAANRSPTLKDYKLSLLSTGADVSFLWISNHADYVRDSRMQWFMDVAEDDWMEDAVKLYKEISPITSKVRGAEIVDFKVEGDVHTSVFDNCVTIIVDYGNGTYRIDEGSVR